MFSKKVSVQEGQDKPQFKSVLEAIRAKAIGSVLAANSLSTGGLKCTTGIKIDGRHFGDVVVDGALNAVCWVSAAASIRGAIAAPTVYVEGAIHGDIFADRVVVMRGGVIDGDVHSEEVEKHDAATLRGRTFKTQPQSYRGMAAEITKKMNG